MMFQRQETPSDSSSEDSHLPRVQLYFNDEGGLNKVKGGGNHFAKKYLEADIDDNEKPIQRSTTCPEVSHNPKDMLPPKM
jgi:hypothetical protein